MVDKITIGGVEYVVKDHPELLKMIEGIRTEEKDKLYSDIAKYKTEIAQLKKDGETKNDTKIKELEKQLEEATKNKDGIMTELGSVKEELKKLAAQKKKPAKSDDDGDGGEGKKEPDLDSMKKMISELLGESSKKQLELVEALQKKIDELEGNSKKFMAESYREKLIAEHKGFIIPEFLRGSSKEELDASLVEALQSSKKYITVDDGKGKRITLEEKEKVEGKVPAGTGSAGSGGADPNNALMELLQKAFKSPPAGQNGGETIVKEISEVKSADWEKEKEGIKAQLIEEARLAREKK